MNPAAPVFVSAEMESYFVKFTILREVKRVLPSLHGKLLDVGCGDQPYKKLLLENNRIQQYVGLDLPTGKYFDHRPPDITWDGNNIPSASESFDCAICLEVLEHTHDPRQVLSEIFRVLKPNGNAVLSVPYLWPLHDAPYDHYRFTPFFFEKALSEIGYKQVKIQSLGGWDASLALMLSLWINRRPFSKSKRRALRLLFAPALLKLFMRDGGSTDWKSGEMFTGLFITASR